MTTINKLVPGGALLGEGPVWDGDLGHLVWVDIDGGIVHRTTLDGVDSPIELGEHVGAAIPRSAGGFVVALSDRVALLDAAGTEVGQVALEPDIADSRMNDAKCDPAGRLFAGSLTHGQAISALYRIDADLTVSTVFTDIRISNGLDWNLDATQMYYIDTLTHQIDVCDYDLATGEVENRRLLVEIPASDGGPDGMTVDADGCLWVALWGGWCVRRFDPTGAFMQQIDLPVQQVTSVGFGGPDLDQLFITSARENFTAEQAAAQPDAGAVFQLDVGVGGRAANKFAG